MEDLAQTLSAEDRAYFGEEAVAEAMADPEIAAASTEKPAEEPAAEQKAEPEKPETTAEDKAEPGKTVPLAALHEERERRKELQARVEQLNEKFARGDERLNQLLQRIQPAQEQPKSVDEDPLAAIKRHDEFVAQQAQAQAQQAQFQQFATAVNQHETQFRATTPDYDAALQHLTEARRAEYEVMGIPAPAIAQALHQDAVNVAAAALRMGKNPAEVIYAMAKNRGYAPAAPKAEEKPAAPAVSAEERIAMLEKGTQAAKSLSGGGGSNSEITLETLASMPDDEFSKITDSQWRKLWGAN